MFASLLETDHREIDEIYRDAVDALWSGKPTSAFEKVDLLWARLAVHIRAEHLRLFPAVPATRRYEAIVELLRRDHNEFMTSLAEAVNLLREPTSDADLKEARQIVIRLGNRLAEHNRLEEETVYRDAGGDLTHEGRSQLIRAIEKEVRNLPRRFGGDRTAAT